MNDAEKLALRCEQASGPDRTLDVEIAAAIDWRRPDWEEGESTARTSVARHGLAWLVDRAETGMTSMWRGIPRYTASIDAAMTLVPEGWELTLTTDGGCRARLHNHEWLMAAHGRNPARSKAVTPALAIAAAALRAQTLTGDHAR